LPCERRVRPLSLRFDLDLRHNPLLITANFADGQPHMQMSRLGQPIQVINSDIDDLHVQPEPGGQLRGRFHLDTNQKFDLTQLQVTLISADSSAGSFGRGFPVEGGDFSGISGVSTVGADGTLILKNVAGGTYYLAIAAKSNNLRDYFTKSITLDGRDVSDFGIPIHTDTSIDVVLSANGASVSGTVVDAKGNPFPMPPSSTCLPSHTNSALTSTSVPPPTPTATSPCVD
jgi:hypothetical protein